MQEYSRRFRHGGSLLLCVWRLYRVCAWNHNRFNFPHVCGVNRCGCIMWGLVLSILIGIIPAIFAIMKASAPVLVRGSTNLLRSTRFGVMLANKLSGSRFARAILAGTAVAGTVIGLSALGSAGVNMLKEGCTSPSANPFSNVTYEVLNGIVAEVFGWFAYGTKINVAANTLFSVLNYLLTLYVYKTLSRAVFRGISAASSHRGGARP